MNKGKINIGYGFSTLRPKITMVDPLYTLTREVKMVGSRVTIEAGGKSCEIELNKKQTIKLYKFINKGE